MRIPANILSAVINYGNQQLKNVFDVLVIGHLYVSLCFSDFSLV